MVVIPLRRLVRLCDARGRLQGTLKSNGEAARYAFYGCGSPNLNNIKFGQPTWRVLVPASKNPLFMRRSWAELAPGSARGLHRQRVTVGQHAAMARQPTPAIIGRLALKLQMPQDRSDSRR
jgi:hypothetical protein